MDDWIGDLEGVEEDAAEKAGPGEGFVGVMALKAGRTVATVGCGRLEAGGGGGTVGVSAFFSSPQASGAFTAALPYKEPADAVGAPNVGRADVGKAGFAAGGGAFLIAVISTLPTGV